MRWAAGWSRGLAGRNCSSSPASYVDRLRLLAGEDEPALPLVFPPAGVDAGAFYDLVSTRQGTFLDNLLAIDKARNNTSLVLLLEWRRWKLLFPADAGRRSWQMMDHPQQLQEVHFLKVSHHGSHTGMPPAGMLDQLLPGEGQIASDGRPRCAVVSIAPQTYSGVADPDTLAELRGAAPSSPPRRRYRMPATCTSTLSSKGRVPS